MTVSRKTLSSMAYFVLLGVIASASYAQSPLYSSDQNQYFLHGLARVGLGFLKNDWLANTTDPTPVFSVLTALTYRYLHENVFYFYYVLMCGVYFYGLVGIASALFNGSSKAKQVTYVALIILMHSALLGRLSSEALRINLRWLLTGGIAGLSILGEIFEPSTVGAFLVLSIFVFLRGRALLAVFFAALAGTVHPTYLLAAGVLVLSYVLVTLKEKGGIREAGLIGLTGLVLVLPIVSYVYVAFKPTSLAVWGLARDILVNVRSPHHFLIRRWLVTTAYVQIAIILAGLYVVRRTRLYPILLFSVLAAVGLTIVQALSFGASLALLLPWRLSVYLVPISSGVLAAYLASRVTQLFVRKGFRFETVTMSLSSLVVMLALLAGTLYMKRDFDETQSNVSVPMMEFVKKTRTASAVYLIPPDLERFRLYTGTPILVDRKAIPYRDQELVEWYERYRSATDFYRLDQPSVCTALARLSSKYTLTHVVLRSSQAGADCGTLRKLYGDGHYGVYSIVQ